MMRHVLMKIFDKFAELMLGFFFYFRLCIYTKLNKY